uniref:Uncharacterized protein n=1 Tax=Anguilla anguilla TaxID=7936 RepID=A0A0E9RQ27_ANGAN
MFSEQIQHMTVKPKKCLCRDASYCILQLAVNLSMPLKVLKQKHNFCMNARTRK